MANDTQTLTLADFLLARIAEDQDAASEAGDYRGPRLLAEVEAKRQIVAALRLMFTEADRRLIFKSLAAIYAEHPDYRKEWRA